MDPGPLYWPIEDRPCAPTWPMWPIPTCPFSNTASALRSQILAQQLIAFAFMREATGLDTCSVPLGDLAASRGIFPSIRPRFERVAQNALFTRKVSAVIPEADSQCIMCIMFWSFDPMSRTLLRVLLRACMHKTGVALCTRRCEHALTDTYV